MKDIKDEPKKKTKGPPIGWDKFLEEKYEKGKKKVTNTNISTKDQFPQVKMLTLYKNDSNFKKKVMKEYKDWIKDNPQDTKSNKNKSKEEDTKSKDTKPKEEPPKPKKVDLESFKKIVSSVLGEHLTKIPDIYSGDFEFEFDYDTEREIEGLVNEKRNKLYEKGMEKIPFTEDAFETIEEYDDAVDEYSDELKEDLVERVDEYERNIRDGFKHSLFEDRLGYSSEDAMSLTGISAYDDMFPRMEKSSFEEGAFNFQVEHYRYVAEHKRKLHKDHIYNEALSLTGDAPKGLGTKIFASQVYHAKRVGLKYISCEAYRDRLRPRWIGYKVWPKMGYDGEIPLDCLEILPEEIKEQFDLLGYEEPYKISHLYSLPDNEGIKWWEENGESFEATFDLEDDSYSMKTFQAYLEGKANSKTASRKYIRRDPFLKGLL
jgi:hypothetical protein